MARSQNTPGIDWEKIRAEDRKDRKDLFIGLAIGAIGLVVIGSIKFSQWLSAIPTP